MGQTVAQVQNFAHSEVLHSALPIDQLAADRDLAAPCARCLSLRKVERSTLAYNGCAATSVCSARALLGGSSP